MYALIGLVLYATIVTGVAVVFGIITYVLAKRLPDTMYVVGMAIRDQSIQDFGLGDTITAIGGNTQGGRPQEGLPGILTMAKDWGLLDGIIAKIRGGVGENQVPQNFNPGLR